MANAPWLPKRTLALVDRGVEALRSVYGDRLQAAAIVGAAASPARHDRARAPQVLAIVASTSVADARSLAETAAKAMRDGLRLRVLTEAELAGSSDVFTLEVAEWRDRHVLLAGENPFDAVTIDAADLRRSLEQSARGISRQLRNRLISVDATGRGSGQEALSAALERTIELAHHTLLWLGKEAPGEEGALLEAFGRWAEVDASAIVKLVAELRGKGRLDDPWKAFESIVPFLDGAKHAVDGMGA